MYRKMKKLILILVISILPVIILSDCVPQEELGLCSCDEHRLTIECNGQEITSTPFTNLNLDEEFKVLNITNTSIVHISNDLFGNASFNEIYITFNPQLQTIHSNALKNGPKRLVISNNRNIITETLFNLTKNLVRTETIEFDNNHIKEIPENAFTPYNTSVKSKLKYIFIHYNNLTTIKSNTFINLPDIEIIGLDHNQLSKIEDYGFTITPSDESYDRYNGRSLIVALYLNHLNNTSFTPKSFYNADSVSVRLDLEYNNLTKIAEDIFWPFMANAINRLSISDNPTECDCGMKWLFNHLIMYNIGSSITCVNKDDKILYLGIKQTDLDCPELMCANNIDPCVCDTNSLSIECHGSTVNNLVLHSIGPQIKTNFSLSFNSLSIFGTNITRIQKFNFANAKFSRILIENNLELVEMDEQIFHKSPLIDSLIIRRNPKLFDVSVYELAKQLEPISIIFSSNVIEEIPDNAFIREENTVNIRLSHIYLDHNRISVVPSLAFFGLKNLTHVSLDHNHITAIEDYGLKIKTAQSFLTVSLNNNQLMASSFTPRSLDILFPTTSSLHLENNDLIALNETLFRPFIEERYGNQMNLFGNKIVCDCGVKWVLNLDYRIIDNMLNIFCANNQQYLLELNQTNLGECQ